MRKRTINLDRKRFIQHQRNSTQDNLDHTTTVHISNTKKKIKVNLINRLGNIHCLLFTEYTPFRVIKERLLDKIKVGDTMAYFSSVNQNRIFDYLFQQGIGVLNTDITISYKFCEQQIIETHDINAYQVRECISIGGFSKVYIVRSKKTGKFFIGKFIDKNLSNNRKLVDMVVNQKSINQALDYPFIAKMHNFIETHNFYIFIIEYCPSGQLFTLMKNHRDISEEDAKFYFIETLLAIRYLHSKGIVYRDLKPENILLDRNGHVKLTDFGLAKIIKNRTYSYCGSLQYMAPQIILGKAHSFAVDYYCLGSLLYELIIGYPPFYNPNNTQS